MIRRQHVTGRFFEDAEAMREAIDVCFKDAYARRINWHYFCDPLKYTYLRTTPQEVIPKPIFDKFMQRLRQWCAENLGLLPVDLPYLHLMVDGCRLGLHSDFHNGTWGYVFSLTRWEERRFSGGETLLLRDGVPSYKKHHVHGDVLYELVPAIFNQLLVFDDRIVHATPTVEGSMDPMEGRIALVGHIRATSPLINGSIDEAEVRKIILQTLSRLGDRIRSYKDVQGTITYRLEVAATGAVESVSVLTDNVVTPVTGYSHSDAVNSVKAIIQQSLASLRFPTAVDSSTVVVPVLVPLPDLRRVEHESSHSVSPDAIRESVAGHLDCIDGLEFRGRWDGYTYIMMEPLAGSIKIEPTCITLSFDPPMWVPSQRERFQTALMEWVKALLVRAGS